MDPVLKGSCACRYIQYTSTQPPTIIVNCHCTQCRKQAGGPYQTGAHFHINSIHWNVLPTIWRSSSSATRTFCPRCGSTISMAYDSEPEKIVIAAGTIDESDASVIKNIPKPSSHIFVKEKATWFDLPDDGAERWDGHSPQKN